VVVLGFNPFLYTILVVSGLTLEKTGTGSVQCKFQNNITIIDMKNNDFLQLNRKIIIY